MHHIPPMDGSRSISTREARACLKFRGFSGESESIAEFRLLCIDRAATLFFFGRVDLPPFNVDEFAEASRPSASIADFSAHLLRATYWIHRIDSLTAFPKCRP
jgi:hypothetical protein